MHSTNLHEIFTSEELWYIIYYIMLGYVSLQQTLYTYDTMILVCYTIQLVRRTAHKKLH